MTARPQAARLRGGVATLWPLLQTAVAGAVAWELARQVPGHERPLFAPIVAIVAMGISAGRRATQAVRLVLGAALGIAIADVLVRLLGSGPFQLGLFVFLAMALAMALSREPIFVTQAGISALLVVAVERQTQGWAPDRLIDALIGAAVALVMSLILFPVDPVAAIRSAGVPVFRDLHAVLDRTAAALRSGDLRAAESARARRVDERRVDDAVNLAVQAARMAPRRRRARGAVAAWVDVAGRLFAIARGSRVIAGSAIRVLRARGGPAPELAEPVQALADAIDGLTRWLDHADAADRDRARERALAAAALAASTPSRELGGATIAHLVQAVAADTLRATGLDGADTQRRLSEALSDAPRESRLPL